MGQANVKRWTPDIMPFLTDQVPLGVEEFVIIAAGGRGAEAYDMFQNKAEARSRSCSSPGLEAP